MSAHRILIVLLVIVLAGCASTGSSGGASADSGGADSEGIMLKIPQEQVPAEVRAIEALIDRKGALVADRVIIECSKNYEWDVSLVGHDVTPVRPDGDGYVSEATGNARAHFRNLELRAYEKITFRKSGFGVVPYIRILAEGHAAYVTLPDGASRPAIKRARTIRIENDAISFDGTPGNPARLASAGPRTGVDRMPHGLRND